ncbi:hypothetical protein E4U53_008142 [Claviceps sorghi]|nr:hypothetical protein E4U53_008142 [Claviceps sorghi]
MPLTPLTPLTPHMRISAASRIARVEWVARADAPQQRMEQAVSKSGPQIGKTTGDSTRFLTDETLSMPQS